MRLARNHTSQLVLSLSICTNEYPSTHVYRLVDNKYGIFPFTTYGHTKQFGIPQFSFSPCQFTVSVGVTVSNF